MKTASCVTSVRSPSQPRPSSLMTATSSACRATSRGLLHAAASAERWSRSGPYQKTRCFRVPLISFCQSFWVCWCPLVVSSMSAITEKLTAPLTRTSNIRPPLKVQSGGRSLGLLQPPWRSENRHGGWRSHRGTRSSSESNVCRDSWMNFETETCWLLLISWNKNHQLYVYGAKRL